VAREHASNTLPPSGARQFPRGGSGKLCTTICKHTHIPAWSWTLNPKHQTPIPSSESTHAHLHGPGPREHLLLRGWELQAAALGARDSQPQKVNRPFIFLFACCGPCVHPDLHIRPGKCCIEFDNSIGICIIASTDASPNLQRPEFSPIRVDTPM
jgi:hypothetical protein